MLRQILVPSPHRVRTIVIPCLGRHGMSTATSVQSASQIRSSATSRRTSVTQTYKAGSAAEAEVVLRSANLAISQGGTLMVDHFNRYLAKERLSDGSSMMLDFVRKNIGGWPRFFRKHPRVFVVLEESPVETSMTVGLTQSGALFALKDARARSDVADALKALEYMGAPLAVKTLPELQPALSEVAGSSPLRTSASSDSSEADHGAAPTKTNRSGKPLKSLLGKKRLKEADYVCAVLACKESARWKEAVAIVEAMDRDFASRHQRRNQSTNSTISSNSPSTNPSAYVTDGSDARSDSVGSGGTTTSTTRTTTAHSTRHYPVSAAISVCARANQPEAALNLLRSLDGQEKNGLPDAVCFGAALDACAKAGWWRAAKQILLVEMPSAGVAPNAYCCAAAISSCGNAGELQEALRLLDWMRAANSSAEAPPLLPESSDGHDFNDSNSNNIMAAHSFRPSPSSSSSSSSFSAPTASAAAASPTYTDDQASTLLRPPPPNLWCYGAAVAACDRASQGADGATAVALLDQMTSDGLTPNVVVLNAALSACGKAGLFAEALDVLHRRFPEANAVPDTITFNAAIHACARSRISGGGLSVGGFKAPNLLAPRQSGDYVSSAKINSSSSSSSSSTIIGDDGQHPSDQGPWTTALALLDAMERDEGGGSDESSSRGSSEPEGRALVTSSSPDLWDDAFREAGVTAGLVTGNSSLVATAQLQHAFSDDDRGNCGVSSSGSSDHRSSSRGSTSSRSGHGTTCAVAPKADVVSYTSAIAASGNAGQVDHAMMLLEEMMFLSEMGHRGVEPNVVSFGAALAACAKAGRWQRCLTLLKEMSLRGLAPNGPCFDTAIDALEAAGQTAEADRVYGLALAAGVYQPYSSMSGNDPASAQPRVYETSHVDSSNSGGSDTNTRSNTDNSSHSSTTTTTGSNSSSSTVATAHSGEASDWDVVDLHSCSAVRCRVALRAALQRYQLPPSPRQPLSAACPGVTDSAAGWINTATHTQATAAGSVGATEATVQSLGSLSARPEPQEARVRPLPNHGLLVVTGVGGAAGAAKRRNARNGRGGTYGGKNGGPEKYAPEQYVAVSSSRPAMLAEAHSTDRRYAPPVLPEEARRFLVQTLGQTEEAQNVSLEEGSATMQNPNARAAAAAAEERATSSQVRSSVDGAQDSANDSAATNATTYSVPGNKGRLLVPRHAIERWLASERLI